MIRISKFSFNYLSRIIKYARAFNEFNACECSNTRKEEGKVIESEDGRSDLFLPRALRTSSSVGTRRTGCRFGNHFGMKWAGRNNPTFSA